MSLTRRTPLRRTGPPKRTTRLRSRGRKADREQTALASFRDALRARVFCDLGPPACEPSPHYGCDPHHLCHADRDRGVHLPERGLWVCRAGHHWVETHPARSYELGWLIRDGAA